MGSASLRRHNDDAAQADTMHKANSSDLHPTRPRSCPPSPPLPLEVADMDGKHHRWLLKCSGARWDVRTARRTWLGHVPAGAGFLGRDGVSTLRDPRALLRTTATTSWSSGVLRYDAGQLAGLQVSGVFPLDDPRPLCNCSWRACRWPSGTTRPGSPSGAAPTRRGRTVPFRGSFVMGKENPPTNEAPCRRPNPFGGPRAGHPSPCHPFRPAASAPRSKRSSPSPH